MKRLPRSTAFLAWLGILAVLATSAPFAPQARAAEGPAGLSAAAPAAAAPAAAVPAAGTAAVANRGQVTALIAGAAHTCAMFGDKTLQCWGNNQYGELGNGTTASASKPVDVQKFSAPLKFAESRAVHTCGLLENATVECWGMNKYGQVGDGTTDNTAKPVAVKGLNGKVRLLSAGGDHTCVTLEEDDSTWCWGQNKYGELGNGEFSVGSLKPVEVKGLPSPPTKFTTGVWHTCTVLEDGSTWCWGHNELGELGNGKTGLGSATPVEVKGLPSTPVQLAAGNFHTCALVQDGSTWCWGEGKYGQLGRGSNEMSSTPKPVTGLEGDPAFLFSGGYHTCVAFKDGGMSCWGQNNFGQLGDGTTKNASKPVAVKGVRPNPTLAAGGALHTCVGYGDGTLNCWGGNTAGQLGNGATGGAVPAPVEVAGLGGATAQNVAATDEGDGSDDGGISTGQATGIGVLALVIVAVAGFLVMRRSRSRA
ncbi:RCC1 domain-containing protein [Actinomadura sp. LOL_016]|uniref:RCC1 domain-containing protein n=1 Tax=Actinomadura sp. LOL_016 TaxID=3345411 RepID=UPI003A8BF6BA